MLYVGVSSSTKLESLSAVISIIIAILVLGFLLYYDSVISLNIGLHNNAQGIRILSDNVLLILQNIIVVIYWLE